MVTIEDKNKILGDLLCSGIGGNQTDYAKFLKKISSLLRPFVAKKITSADVEDVLQEILISIHKARHTYDGERPIMPWIISIARFRMADYFRKYYAQMRHKVVDNEEMENIFADVTNEVFDNEPIDELLEEVTLQNKQILTLIHVEGYTAKEVGAKIGMNESAVKVAAHRAIKKIRNKFKI
jgi:RNA polymerase sigma-70 factor (ECF subfamily)